MGNFRVAPSLCFKLRLSAKLLIWKWLFILMQMRLIFTKKVLPSASFWKWEFSLFHLHFSHLHLNWGNCYKDIRELNQRRRRRQRELKKSYRVRLAKQQLCTCITLFCTFLSRRCTSTTWKCLISRFFEDGNRRQQLSFSFPELWYSPFKSFPTPKNVLTCDELNKME